MSSRVLDRLSSVRIIAIFFEISVCSSWLGIPT